MAATILDDDGFVRLKPQEDMQPKHPLLAGILAYGDDGEGVARPLGTYTPMSSPGKITLYRDNIGGFFWELVYLLAYDGLRIAPDQLKCLQSAMVYITFEHELFHHYCDIFRSLTSSAKDRLEEEALAVAWSWHRLHEHPSLLAILPDEVKSAFLKIRFNYTAPGYQDWSKYQHRHCFERAAATYWIGEKAEKLRRNGVGVDAMFKQLLENAEWTSNSVVIDVVPPCPATTACEEPHLVKNEPAPKLGITDKAEAEIWLQKMGISPLMCAIDIDKVSEDGCVTVTVHTAVDLSGRQLKEFPVKFGVVEGNFDCSGNRLHSLSRFPSKVKGDLYCCGNQIRSLEGIAEVLHVEGRLCVCGNPIERSGVGAVLIEPLTAVYGDSRAFAIINEHVGSPKDVFDCQEKLIDGGLDPFAEW